MIRKTLETILDESKNDTAFNKLIDKTKDRTICMSDCDFIQARNLARKRKLLRNGKPNISALFQQLVQKDYDTFLNELQSEIAEKLRHHKTNHVFVLELSLLNIKINQFLNK